MFNKISTAAIVILVFTSIALIIFTLSNSLIENSGSNPISFPSESAVTVEFEENDDSGDFIVIRDNYIYALLKDGSYTPISLSDKNWRNIKLSPDKTRIAVIGKEGDNREDLFIYNFESQLLNKVTFFQDQETGVTDFFWVNDSLIAFHQDQWLHSLNAESLEIKKLELNIKEVKGSADNKVAMNTLNNTGAIYNFANESLLNLDFQSEILSATNNNSRLTLILDEGTFALIENNLEEISNITGSVLCNDLVKTGNSIVNYKDLDIVVESFPSEEIKCAGNEFYYRNASKWYTLSNKEELKLQNAIYFDKF